MAGPLSVVLVSDRRAEQRHDAVAGELVDGTLEAVDAVREDREEPIQDPVPLLGVDALGDVHRSLHVGEEHRHLFTLAFERASGREDPLPQVRGRVCPQVANGGLDGARERASAAVAMLLPRGILRRTARTLDHPSEWLAALAAEAGAGAIVERADGTAHRGPRCERL